MVFQAPCTQLHLQILKMKDITVLCKVVDNYGDIGFVYRLTREISRRRPELRLRIVVSNLSSFAAMAPGLDAKKARQEYNGNLVLDWNNEEICTKEFTENPPEIIFECFQCGRPEWLENLLFSKENPPEHTVQIVNVEYLTAEDWADDFHLLKSGTRSAKVKKINFMPGFTARTGGLVLDSHFMKCLEYKDYALKTLQKGLPEPTGRTIAESVSDGSIFPVLIFSYPRDFSGIISGLAQFQEAQKKKNPRFTVCIFAANGISLEPLIESHRNAGEPFPLIRLPYISQRTWDALLTLTKFNLIRGEDSFSRACLSGIPFLWHAYPQENEFQLVKTRAVLSRIEPFFGGQKKIFENYASLTQIYNRTPGKDTDADSQEAMNDYPESAEFTEAKRKSSESTLFCNLLLEYDTLSTACKDFSRSLISNGDLAEHLLSYCDTLDFSR